MLTTRRTILIMTALGIASPSLTALAQSSHRPDHAGRGRGSGRDHASGHSSGGHTDGSHDDSDHADGGHTDDGHTDDGHTDGGHTDGGHDDTDHASGGGHSGGKKGKGPKYRGGRDISGNTHGRGRSLEDRVLRANKDILGGH